MDRDHARSFMKKTLDSELAFVKELEEMRKVVEETDDWENTTKNFAPKIKQFYNNQLEAWQRFYLGLDVKNYNQGHGVMHLAQKKERKSVAPTIPHSMYAELKYKMKVGTANKLTASGGQAAREIMEQKLGGAGIVLETKGQGGNIGGKDEKVFSHEEVEEANGSAEQGSSSGPATAPKTPPAAAEPPKPETAAPVEKPKPGAPKEVKPDEQLAEILQRRKKLYSETRK